MWVHADAAYGGFFRLAAAGPALMPELEECDSITLDPHKGMFLPYGTGCLLVRDPESLRQIDSTDAEYLHDVRPHESASFADLSPELSRDFRGLRIWLPLVLHGLGAFKDAIEEKLMLARWAYDRLSEDSRSDAEGPGGGSQGIDGGGGENQAGLGGAARAARGGKGVDGDRGGLRQAGERGLPEGVGRGGVLTIQP